MGSVALGKAEFNVDYHLPRVTQTLDFGSARGERQGNTTLQNKHTCNTQHRYILLKYIIYHIKYHTAHIILSLSWGYARFPSSYTPGNEYIIIHQEPSHCFARASPMSPEIFRIKLHYFLHFVPRHSLPAHLNSP
jgi:hypothetical protein